MAFLLSGMSLIGRAFGRAVHVYHQTDDTIATIQGSGYFNAISTTLTVGDFILAMGSNGASPLYVATNSGGIVTTAAATSGSAVSITLLNILAATLDNPIAPDTAASRDRIPFHSAANGDTRQAYVDRLEPNLRMAMRSGRYYGSVGAVPGIATTFAVSANVHYASPFIVRRRTTIAAVSAHVTVLHASNFRLGIYACENGLPGALLFDAGEVSAGTTGVKDIALATTLEVGLYFLTAVFAGTPTMRATGVNTAPTAAYQFFEWIGCAAPGTHDSRLSNALTYGALPSTFGAVSYAAGESPAIYIKA